MFKKTLKLFGKGTLARGVLRGFGGVVMVGIGMKIAEDIYDGVKKRIKQPARSTETIEEHATEEYSAEE